MKKMTYILIIFFLNFITLNHLNAKDTHKKVLSKSKSFIKFIKNQIEETKIYQINVWNAEKVKFSRLFNNFKNKFEKKDINEK